MALEFSEAMGIPLENCVKLKAAFTRLRLAVNGIQAQDAVVAGNNPNEQYIFLPPGNPQWAGVEAKFRAEVAEAVGSEAANYILEASKNDFEAWTGQFGRVPRVMKIAFNDSKWTNNDEQWQVQVESGPRALVFADYFEKDVRAALQSGVSTSAGWVDQIAFGRDVPDFLKDIISHGGGDQQGTTGQANN